MSDAEKDTPFAQQLYRWYAHAEPDSAARDAAIERIVAARSQSSVPGAGAGSRGRIWLGAATLAVAASAIAVFGVSRFVAKRFGGTSLPLVTVELQVAVPSAQRVNLAGDFNGWDARKTPMTQDPATGQWRATLRLPPGRHAYSYVVDGSRWIVDAVAPQASSNEFGETNVLAVGDQGALHD